MFTKWGGGEVLKKAVRGMLPKNRLRDKRLARLKGKFEDIMEIYQEGANFGFHIVFEGLAHPYKENIVKFAGGTHIVKPEPESTTKMIEAVKPLTAE